MNLLANFLPMSNFICSKNLSSLHRTVKQNMLNPAVPPISLPGNRLFKDYDYEFCLSGNLNTS